MVSKIVWLAREFKAETLLVSEGKPEIENHSGFWMGSGDCFWMKYHTAKVLMLPQMEKGDRRRVEITVEVLGDEG